MITARAVRAESLSAEVKVKGLDYEVLYSLKVLQEKARIIHE